MKFISVRFSCSNGTLSSPYFYKTDLTNLKKGDLIWVPTSPGGPQLAKFYSYKKSFNKKREYKEIIERAEEVNGTLLYKGKEASEYHMRQYKFFTKKSLFKKLFKNFK